jgi:hypothetical protein
MLAEGSDFDGWTLDEARTRIPDLLTHLSKGRLLAWERLGDPSSELRPVPVASWTDISFPKRSRKGEAVCSDQPVFDLRILPVLEAPNVVDHLGQRDTHQPSPERIRHDPLRQCWLAAYGAFCMMRTSIDSVTATPTAPPVSSLMMREGPSKKILLKRYQVGNVNGDKGRSMTAVPLLLFNIARPLI